MTTASDTTATPSPAQALDSLTVEIHRGADGRARLVFQALAGAFVLTGTAAALAQGAGEIVQSFLDGSLLG